MARRDRRARPARRALRHRRAPRAAPRAAAPARRAPRPLPRARRSAAFELFVRSLVTANPATSSTLLTRRLEQAPAFDEARFELWQVYSDQGEHQRARTAVDAIPAGGPNAPRGVSRSRVRAAARTLSRGDGAASARCIASSADAARGQRHGRRAAAASRRRARRRPTCSARPPALDPDDADLFFNLGYAHWIAREYPQAVAGAARGGAAQSGRRRRALRARRGAAGERRGRGGRAREGSGPPPVVGLQRARCPPQRQLGAARPRAPQDRASTPPRAPASTARLAAAGQREQRELAGFYLANGRRLFQAGPRRRRARRTAARRVPVAVRQRGAPADRPHPAAPRPRAGGHRRAEDFGVEPRYRRAPVLTLAEAYVAAREYAAARAEAAGSACAPSRGTPRRSSS